MSPFGSPNDNQTELSGDLIGGDESSVALSVSMTQKQPHPAILISNMGSLTSDNKSATIHSKKQGRRLHDAITREADEAIGEERDDLEETMSRDADAPEGP